MPRGRASSSRISCMVRALGAPVIEPVGCAGDRTGGKQRAEHVMKPDAGSCPRCHLRRELPDRRVSLGGEQVGDLDAADSGDPGQVVAEQIDDHQVLGSLLGAGAQPADLLGVLLRGSAAGGGALHRTRPQAVACPLEEQLRTGAHHDVATQVEVGVVGAAPRRAGPRPDRRRTPRDRRRVARAAGRSRCTGRSLLQRCTPEPDRRRASAPRPSSPAPTRRQARVTRW